MKLSAALIIGAGLLLAAQACFAEDQGSDQIIPAWIKTDLASLKTELAGLSEDGRTAFKKTLFACSLYVDEPTNDRYHENCTAASVAFNVEVGSEEPGIASTFGLLISKTETYAVQMALQQGRHIGPNGARALIATLHRAYWEYPGGNETSEVATSNPSKTENQILIPLQRQGGVFVVPLRINKAITLNFTVDSGAADVSIPADVALILIRTGTLQDADLIGAETYKLADGSTVPSTTFRIRSITANKVEIENVKARFAPIAGQLLLGQSFLSRFKSWSIDNTKQALVLTQ